MRATLALVLALGVGCRSADPRTTAAPAPAAQQEESQRSRLGTLTLVETAPVETDLDHPDLREAWEVWIEMIDGARRTIDLEHFYASNRAGSRLEPVIAALERAGTRGVAVRFLADAGFYETYPDTLDRLAAADGVELRLFDLRARTGGVLHAKAMIVDEVDVFVGSQNFDWRSLEHIQELGLRVRSSPVGLALADVFEHDWRLAGGDDDPAVEPRVGPTDFPVVAALEDGGRVALWPALSPEGLLPEPAFWDLPRMVEVIDGAEERVRVQLLSYKAVGRDRTYWDALEGALRRAAARGVAVELCLADWSKRKWTIEGLQSLQCLPGIEVRLVTIPQAQAGFIPFGRVIHAKYLVVDGSRAWLGTSNWEKSYFTTSRNLGFIVEGEALAARLDAFFEDVWSSPYAETVDPAREYEPPRVSD